MTRVFVSSVSKVLTSVRQKIIAQLQTAGYDVGAMELFGAQPPPPLDVCLRELRKSDVVVLIVGPSYGSPSPQGISYTHAEFREACALGIPVLAFRVVPAADQQQDEQDQLASFLTEVGSVTTYKSLAPGDGVELLTGEIQAALAAACERGELKSRYSLFQPFDRFYARQLGPNAALFNHKGPFLGRDAELGQLKNFLHGDEPVLLLKAPGGSGKSRLLLEFAKHAASVASAPQVLFVNIGGQWTANDINRLPITPLILVVDDAHRRPDLDKLILECLQQNAHARFVASCRPSAVNIVTPHIALLSTKTDIAQIALHPLSNDDAETLAGHHLGPDLAQYASRLVRIADRNPLVIAVGGKCIAERRVFPEELERTPELFRSLVLDRLLDDPALSQADTATRRKALEVIAAVGPVASESDEFLASLSSMAGLPKHEMRHVLAVLEKASFLLRRGRFIRVSPDILADHLLYKAAVDENGRPTGFVEEMVRAFARTQLDNILANAAELDWRAWATANHESVLATTWRDLLARLPDTTNAQRTALVGQLKRSAAFAPADVLRIVEWIADHRAAPPDKALLAWGVEDTFERVADRLTETLAFIATHLGFTDRCVRRLWEFATSDTRPTNPNPSHPRRCLEDLLKYDWRADWRSADGVHVRIIEFILSKLRESPRKDDRSWAIALVGTALDRLGEANESNRTTVTIRQFSLARFLPFLAARRNTVMTCLRELALGANIIEAAAALREVSQLIDVPRGPFGSELEAEELAKWQSEAERAIWIVSDIARTAASDVIRFLARRSLREASHDSWPAIVPALESGLAVAPPTRSEMLYDLLTGLPWKEQLDHHKAEQKRVNDLCDAAAAAFWRQYRTPTDVVAAFHAAETAIRTVVVRGESHGGRLVRSLVSANPDQATVVVAAFVGLGEPGWRYLRPALLATHDLQPANAVGLADALTQREPNALRAYAAESLEWMADTESTWKAVLAITERLSQDRSPLVRRVVAPVLCRFREKAPTTALSILVSIDWAGDISVATAVLEALHPEYGLDPILLGDSDIDRLLERIAGLDTLEGRTHDILEFIAFASKRRPERTVEILLQRVLAVDEHQGDKGADLWTPIPYNGHGLFLPGLSASDGYPVLLRRIRDAQLGASIMTRFWLPPLFNSAASDLNTALSVLQEWLQSGQADKIIGVSNLLGSFDHSIVFSIDEFIATLLDAAALIGHDCLERTRGKLYGIAIGGTHSSSPGQPAPRYVVEKASAQALVTKYAFRPAVRDFYESLVRHAESSIERDMMHWEETGDE